MSHIVDCCLQTTFTGGLTILLDAEEDDVNWLNSVAILQHSRNNNNNNN